MIATVVIALALALPVSGLKPEGRVVNGKIADPHSFPWQLSLMHGISHICGAVFYNKNYAITAAHCVDWTSKPSFSVACGSHDISKTEPSRQVVEVSRIIIHPSYNPNGNGFPNDIAVLRLSSPLTINSVCQPAKLDTDYRDFNKTSAVITGWGRIEGGGRLPNKLKMGEVEVLSHKHCQSYSTIVDKYLHVCVKDLRDRIYGGCNGDSGGPVQLKDDTVIGLASFVWGYCVTSMPTVYTRLSTYIRWIEAITQ